MSGFLTRVFCGITGLASALFAGPALCASWPAGVDHISRSRSPSFAGCHAAAYRFLYRDEKPQWVNRRDETKSKAPMDVPEFVRHDTCLAGVLHKTSVPNVSDNIRVEHGSAQQSDPSHSTRWPTDKLDWRKAPVDLSFLNAHEKPAGKRGFLRADHDRLVFEDGTPARFWGTNLTAYALFGTSRMNVRRQARRLSELGFNLVRLHHHDSPWVNPNIFGKSDLSSTRSLSDAALAQLDWWIYCLKNEGIYIWLDLHVQRSFRKGDGIDGFDEIRKGDPEASLKGYNYVNPQIRRAMQRFNNDYLGHENPHTKLRYKDDPAIAAILITNENDVTNHYGNTLLPDKNVPRHSARYMHLARDFAAAHGLPKNATWKSWEPGPAKIFLNDLEYQFNAAMITSLRTQGVRAPLVTTSTWGFNPLNALPALTAGNVIDVHSYGGIGELETNPIVKPNFMHWIAAAQLADRPLSASEWNVEPFPTPDRHVTPLYVAASASLQGWDALMQYAYSQIPMNTAGYASNWHAYNDPSLLATLPAAALLYRRGDVRESDSIYAFAPDRKDVFYKSISPKNAIGLRTAAERGKLIIVLPRIAELPWLPKNSIPSGAKVFTDPRESFISSNAVGVTSDSGELRRNWQQGTYIIDTPRTQAAVGRIGGRRIICADIDVILRTGNAAIAIQSLDYNPIRKSRAIMISMGSRSVPEPDNKLPFRSEPVAGQIIIQAPQGLKLYAQYRGSHITSSNQSTPNQTLRHERQLPAPFKNGRYHITIPDHIATSWLILK